ncbi:IniB N-terminal domain-containing protein [Actinoplanes sp. NPDC049265]|uniref:IniB N-terminal domain-containing protein n=1 Tax=Actinoplanes sp. NPDC049265 TaxID=3363902 RepID=UPI0037137DC8
MPITGASWPTNVEEISMDASPTLHDFVLNLLYDTAARQAFELDPEATLQHAGLGDVTAVDVQQVIPMVVDYAPVAGVTDIAGVDDITTGVANLDVAGAVAQLQAITSHAALAPAQGVVQDLNLTVSGVHTTVVGVAGEDLLSGSVLSGGALNLDGIGSVTTGTVADLSVDHDPALDLDSGVAVQGTVNTVVPGAGDLLPETDLRPIETLDNVTHVVNVPATVDLGHSTGLDVSGVEGATSSVVSSVVKTDLTDDVTHSVHSTVTGTVHGTVDTVHGVTGNLLGGHQADTDTDSTHGGALGGLTDLHL